MKLIFAPIFVVAFCSSSFALTASEIGKQYFPEYQSAKSTNCDALKMRFGYDKSSSFAGYTVNMPLYLAVQPFTASVEVAKNAPRKETKRFGLDIMSLSSEKFDNDFTVVNFDADISSSKQSMSLYFDRLEN